LTALADLQANLGGSRMPLWSSVDVFGADMILKLGI
jgi:hypothetical protein